MNIQFAVVEDQVYGVGGESSGQSNHPICQQGHRCFTGRDRGPIDDR